MQYYIYDPVVGCKRKVDIEKLAKVLCRKTSYIKSIRNGKSKLPGLSEYLVDETFKIKYLRLLRDKVKLENEVWIDLKYNPRRYEISNYGRIRIKYKKKKELLATKFKFGAVRFVISDEIGNRKKLTLARTVYEHFIGEIKEGECVRHKEDVMKCDIWSLEKLSVKDFYKARENSTKPIIRVDPVSGDREYYESINIAAKENFIDRTLISQVINGKRMLAAGYMWEEDEVRNYYV